MTQYEYTGRLLKEYYMAHSAARMDLEILERFSNLSLGERKRRAEEFLHWFRMHAQIWEYEMLSTTDFVFPAIGGNMPDGETFLAYSRDRHREGRALQEQIFSLLEKGEVGDELVRLFKEYKVIAWKYLDHHEALFLPIILQKYTHELNQKIQRAFVKHIGLRGASVLLPWMLTRSAEDDKRAFLRAFPPLGRWMYLLFWEPAYKKRYPLFVV